MKALILDLDCVVFDVAGLMQESFADATGKEIPVSQWDRYHIDAIYEVPMRTLLDVLITDQVLERATPFNGAKEATNLLRQKGYRIMACSNRAFHPNAHSMTLESLSRHSIHVDDLIINPDSACKGLSCQRVAPAGTMFTHIIDDHCANTGSALRNKVVKEAVLISQPWNRNSSSEHYTLRYGSLIEFAMWV